MASGNQDRVFRAMYELNLSPGFRAEESPLRRVRRDGRSACRCRAARSSCSCRRSSATTPAPACRGSRLPTLVIHGTVDRVLGYPNGPLIASLIPDARLETLEDVGHMFWWEQPARAAELIRAHALASA